jgi:hypothetical protein
MDDQAQIISALGEKVGVGSIFSMLWKISAALARMKEKKIEGNQVGDYSRKGGILVVGRGGGFHGFTMEVGPSPRPFHAKYPSVRVLAHPSKSGFGM